MSYRRKLLLLFTLTVLLVTAVVAAVVSSAGRNSFERLDQQRTDALVSQFRREFSRRGDEVTRRIAVIAARDSTLRMAADLGRSSPDLSIYVNDAAPLASALQLDFLEFVARDGTIISSAQWPARFGYREDWLLAEPDWSRTDAFLKREDLPDANALALVAVRPARAGDSLVYVAGGERLDRDFLASLGLPEGMRAMLYRNSTAGFSPDALTGAAGPVQNSAAFGPIVQQVQQQPRELSQLVTNTAGAGAAEMVHAIPLAGRQGEPLGVLLVSSSRHEIVALERHIRLVALLVGAGGILLGVLLSGWAATRVTRPVEALADAAREVASGNWWAQVRVTSDDEFGELAASFNRMVQELGHRQEKLVQAERVAAWRELARRLAHELKNPLFPLQITVENLVRARQQAPEQFEEIFRESANTLLAEISNLKTIISRFSDFAKMPAPQLQPVSLNEIVTQVAKLLEPKFNAPGRPPISGKLELDGGLPIFHADPDLLHRAVSNLVLNAMDAMPEGGTLTLRTAHTDDSVQVEVSDTGSGLTEEERERLFTPYYTTRQHGTGLGLAIVQSVVSDHHGKISVESERARGSTFRIELPRHMPDTTRARGANV